jgi:hypothetical protein
LYYSTTIIFYFLFLFFFKKKHVYSEDLLALTWTSLHFHVSFQPSGLFVTRFVFRLTHAFAKSPPLKPSLSLAHILTVGGCKLFILARLSPSFGGTSEVPRLCCSPAMIIVVWMDLVSGFWLFNLLNLSIYLGSRVCLLCFLAFIARSMPIQFPFFFLVLSGYKNKT